jgi:hypothetical protein
MTLLVQRAREGRRRTGLELVLLLQRAAACDPLKLEKIIQEAGGGGVALFGEVLLGEAEHDDGWKALWRRREWRGQADRVDVRDLFDNVLMDDGEEGVGRRRRFDGTVGEELVREAAEAVTIAPLWDDRLSREGLGGEVATAGSNKRMQHFFELKMSPWSRERRNGTERTVDGWRPLPVLPSHLVPEMADSHLLDGRSRSKRSKSGQNV